MGGYVRMTMKVYMSKIEMSRGLLKELDIKGIGGREK